MCYNAIVWNNYCTSIIIIQVFASIMILTFEASSYLLGIELAPEFIKPSIEFWISLA